MHTYWTSIDSCQNRVPADQYHLTVSRAQVSTHRGQVFLKLSDDKLLVFKWSQAQVQFFLKFIWNMLCLCAAQLKFWLQTDLRRENSASCYRQGRQLLLTFFSSGSRVGYPLRPIFMLWLVKIWQVSSCGKFLQHLKTCLLIAESCVILWRF